MYRAVKSKSSKRNRSCLTGIIVLFLAFGSSRSIKAINGVVRSNPSVQLEAVDISNSLAVQLFHQLISQETGNVFFSPYSITSALAMMYMGTRGNSSSQLRQLLNLERLNLYRTHIHESFRQLSDAIATEGKKNSKYSLKIGNMMLVEELYPINPMFKDGVHRFYNAQVQAARFDKEAPAIVNWVNAWITWKTGGGIKTLLERPPSTDTALVLLNAIYFRGTWESPSGKFSRRKYARRINFYNNGRQKAEVNMLKERAVHPYGYYPVLDSFIMELPYASGNLSMVLLLPRKRDGLHYLERSVSLRTLAELPNFVNKTELDFAVPAFRLEEKYDLKSCLASMGLTSLFRPFGADLTGMSPLGDLYVSRMMHRASIEVTDHGSEAFGATSDEPLLGNLERPQFTKFFADHPFMFLVRHNPTGLYLFMGRINKL